MESGAVVVTGVSSGIGLATAQELIRSGYRVFGSVRRREDADRLQAELGKAYHPLLMDVTDADAVAAAARTTEAALVGEGLVGLVNNAGISVAGPLMHLSLDDLRRQFEVSVFGVLTVTQAFLPLLGAQAEWPHPPGRIVNLGSVSGHIVYPFLAPYAAAKHALEALSDGLRRELKLYGIDVVVIVAGAVDTPIWDKAAAQDASVFAETDYAAALAQMRETAVRMGHEGMPAGRVANTIRVALETPKPKTRYLLTNNRLLGWVMPRAVPVRWFDYAVTKQLGIDALPEVDEDDAEPPAARESGDADKS